MLSVVDARIRAVIASISLVAALCAIVLFAAPGARADTAPASGTPATVSADPLPTVQQNGVIWSEVTVGNIVYAAGSFSQTWPAGTANTAANYTPRANLLAFNITTGALTSFNHVLNAQALTITASPDGSTIYVGGDFTTVDGVTRNHIAAFSTATGALTSWAPSFSGEVESIAVNGSGSTIYVGGNYFSVNGVSRTRLAAITSGGSLTSWAPTADNNMVTALVVTPDQSEVVIGGRFSSLNGVSTPGLGAVTTASGTAVPYAINQYVQDYSSGGNGAGITSLTTDGTQVYGSGFSYNAGNFEGTFGVDPDTGKINFLNDCHGDTYGVYVTGKVLYDVSHEHDCSATGNFPDTSPRILHHASAWTTYATGTNTGPDTYGWNYNGIPDSTLLDWFPQMTIGSVTGQNQAAWSITGNGNYIALGGEFPSVNGVAQQGIVRYAISSLAPNKVGPTPAASLTPTATSYVSGTARISWQATWDQDNQNLTYNLLRDGSSTPIYSVTQASTFWQLPTLSYTDTGLTPGSTHTYRIQAVDPFGNKVGSSTSAPVTISSTPAGPYVKDVTSDGAGNFWRFNEASGSTAYDWLGSSNMTEGSGVVEGAPGPLSGDASTAATFNGTTNGTASTSTAITGPNTFSIEGWFKTTSTSGGKIVGFGNTTAGSTSSSYDRQVYMTNSGQLVFGVYNNATYTVTSNNAYNNGAWHYVVAELSGSGMALYVDGTPVGTNSGTTTGQSYSGYWRVGGDNLSGWPSQPASNNFTGAIADVAIYPSALSLSQVDQHYTDAGGQLSSQPAPTDAYGKAVYSDNPLLYWRLQDAAGSTSAVDTSPYQDNGVVSGGVTFGQPSQTSTATAASFNGQNGVVASSQSFTNPTTYSEELWFKTTTTSGGKLIGFGNQQSGNSSSYDRHVYMLNTGQLEFGTYTGQTNTIISPASYNDGQWHDMVATQGSGGMTLYVDGQQVGTNPQTSAQNYTGYWRVGGDPTWGGASSNYFAGSIDEVAVFPTALSASRVLAQYEASPAAVNPPPTAVIATPVCSNLTCSFDGTGSTDTNGTVTGYSWNFGDGSGTSAASKPTYTFTKAGTYTVTLTVTDSFGQTSTSSTTVTVTAPPGPTATIATPSCTYLSCTFDGSGSSSPGATVTGYSWDFGDNTAASTAAKPSHTYSSPGTYTVKLTVTDSNKLTSSSTTTVTVTAPPVAPNAAFSSSCPTLTCSFDASATSTPSGAAITGYAWNFGDGDTGTGAKPSESYPAAGTYTVTLTVTDANGLTNSVTHQVTPAPAGNPTITPYVNDSFGRSVTSGWGTSDSGAAWSPTGSATSLSVASGVGSIKMSSPGSGPGAYVPSVASTDSSSLAVVTTNATPTGNGTYVDLVGRRISSNTDYRGRIILGASGSITVTLLANNAGTATTLKSKVLTGLTYTPGMKLDAQLVVTGTNPTTVSMKVWPAGSTQPSSWQVSATNSITALQSAGSVGIAGYLPSNATVSPVTLQVSSFTSGPSTGLPTAAFTASCSGQTCSTDADNSTDPSGTISSYQWSWGDGVVTTGLTASHTYAQAGTYTVTLTVTNPSGYTSTATKTVTVPA